MTATALKPTTLDRLKKTRTVVAEGPSGNVYRLRPINLERYALSGAIPQPLRKIAREGAEGIDAVFSEENDSTLVAGGSEVRDFLDNLVRQVIVEPDLSNFDLDELPPVDYRWAVSIAMNEEDKDGRGRLLWGQEPLSRWDTWRLHHDCPEDCESCQKVLNTFRLFNS